MGRIRFGDGVFFTAYKRESIELFEVGDEIAELTAIRRDPISGDLYDLTFNNVTRGGSCFPSDDAAIKWAEKLLNDDSAIKVLFGYERK